MTLRAQRGDGFRTDESGAADDRDLHGEPPMKALWVNQSQRLLARSGEEVIDLGV